MASRILVTTMACSGLVIRGALSSSTCAIHMTWLPASAAETARLAVDRRPRRRALQAGLGDVGLAEALAVDAQGAVIRAHHVRAALVAAQDGLGLVHVAGCSAPRRTPGTMVAPFFMLDEAEGGILHGELLRDPSGPRRWRRWSWSRQLVEGGAHDHRGFVVVHRPTGSGRARGCRCRSGDRRPASPHQGTRPRWARRGGGWPVRAA